MYCDLHGSHCTTRMARIVTRLTRMARMAHTAHGSLGRTLVTLLKRKTQISLLVLYAIYHMTSVGVNRKKK